MTTVKIPTPGDVYAYDYSQQYYVRAILEKLATVMNDQCQMANCLTYDQHMGFYYRLTYVPTPGESGDTDAVMRSVAAKLTAAGWKGTKFERSDNPHSASCYFLLPRDERTIDSILQEEIKSRNVPDLEPTQAETPVLPWAMPRITLEPLAVEDILKELRQRVNDGYMPTANGRVPSNSKPEYLEYGTIGKYLEDSPSYAFNHGSGYYADGKTNDSKIYVALHLIDFMVVVELHTEKTWVRVDRDNNPFHEWTDQLVPINRYTLIETLENYI